MKMVILVMMTFFGTASFAREAKSVEVKCIGEVRYGSFFSDSVLFPFEDLLKVELAKKLIHVPSREHEKKYNEAVINCSYDFNPKTFYRLNHEAFMKLSFDFKDGKYFDYEFVCPALVQDGGHQTLKHRCARKMASIIRKIMVAN